MNIATQNSNGTGLNAILGLLHKSGLDHLVFGGEKSQSEEEKMMSNIAVDEKSSHQESSALDLYSVDKAQSERTMASFKYHSLSTHSIHAEFDVKTKDGTRHATIDFKETEEISIDAMVAAQSKSAANTNTQSDNSGNGGNSGNQPNGGQPLLRTDNIFKQLNDAAHEFEKLTDKKSHALFDQLLEAIRKANAPETPADTKPTSLAA